MSYPEMKQYFDVLDIKEEAVAYLTISDAKAAYRKRALQCHPDKNGVEFTAVFQELVHSYREVLKHILAKLKDDDNANEANKDDNAFVRDNFENFNFPKDHSTCSSRCMAKLFGRVVW